VCVSSLVVDARHDDDDIVVTECCLIEFESLRFDGGSGSFGSSWGGSVVGDPRVRNPYPRCHLG
jgi:hypothetical protein